LTSLTIPNNVTELGDFAFAFCSGLPSVSLPSNITSIYGTFCGCTQLKSVTIPNSVTWIGTQTFADCSSLTSITIPGNVTSIGDWAFSGCRNLGTIYCYSEKVPELANDVFKDSFIEYTTLHVPDHSIELYKNDMEWGKFGEIVTIKPAHTLIYIIDDVEYKRFNLEEDIEITPEDEPTKEGYTFSGWNEIPAIMPANDVTVTGSFTINKYKLIYKVDGEEYKTSEMEYGSAITPEAEPIKEGYTFSGWNIVPATMPAKDITVTGSFNVNSYKLVYKVDGEEYKIVDVAYGASIIAEAAPTKDGYTFSGWSEIPQTMPAKDVTITGSFTINSYKLTYMVDAEEHKSVQVKYGAAITLEAEPTKEGYTFSGWSEIPATMPAKDVTVTGSFNVNNYILTYMVDGEEYKTIDVEYGAGITPEAEPIKEGYTFSGWNKVPATMPADDITVTGSFAINSYKLTYTVDGEEYKSVQVKYGEEITAEAEPTKEGCTFLGWNDIPATMPAKDITVTGSFNVNNYKLTYMVDGEEYKIVDVAYGASIIAEAAPTKEGYSFSGWVEMPATMPSHDVTVTGSFTINKYTLAYVVDGENYVTYEVNYGTQIFPLPELTKDGYTFSGWSTIPETMPAHDVTITGTFTFIDAIEGVTAADDEYQIYTIDGKPVETLQKGVNLIRFSNGTTKKVGVK
jgi:uncharacterized repeat protein (TIGR02543 family)